MIQKPRGTRDFLPEEMSRRRYVEDRLRKIFRSFGYREVQTPTFEHLELFTAKSGESIVNEMYVFRDKSGRELALRPELTAPVIRMYYEKLKREPKPLKLFYFGNCYRYDRPQKARYREFTQAGCELIGYNSDLYLAELIALAHNALKKIGLNDIELRIGNLDLVSEMLDKIGVEERIRKEIFPLIDKKCFEEVRRVLLEKGFSEGEIENLENFFDCNGLEELKEFVDNESVSNFERVLSYLELFGVKDFKVDMSIVRGLVYYQGLVFEIDFPFLGAEKQICGGGCYELLSIFGKETLPTAGFAIGFDRVMIALEETSFSFPDDRIDVYVIPLSEEFLGYSIEISNKLREKGFLVDIELGGREIRKALRHASNIGARNVILIGKKEFSEKKVTIRNMDTGEQKTIALDRALELIR
ncbi:MAG: histidine--tRNA ligase [Thermoprotei archaeon]|nr:MAG: histidine--tRNA ligase [Thermoprotei archaeon]